MRLHAGIVLALMASTAAYAAPAADPRERGEELKAAAIAKIESDITAAMEKKAEAGKADNRPAVKQAFADLKHLKTQLLKAKAKTPEEYVAEDEEKARIAKAEAERMTAEWKKKQKEKASAEIAAQKARGLPMPAGVNPIEVVFVAQAAVKKRLKNPADAKFPGGLLDTTDLRSHCKYNGDNTYTVTSWVDATNSFGGKVRTAYVAVLLKSGDGWVTKDVVLIE